MRYIYLIIVILFYVTSNATTFTEKDFIVKNGNARRLYEIG